jgi:hypothetical protein
VAHYVGVLDDMPQQRPRHERVVEVDELVSAAFAPDDRLWLPLQHVREQPQRAGGSRELFQQLVELPGQL